MLKNEISIFFKRGFVWNFEELPTKSIALDGAVRGPLIDNENLKYSFDHHENCIRHVSNATCVQVLDAILLGFDSKNYNVYLNDIDADTIASICLLSYPEIAKNHEIQSFIRNLGIIDAHGPAYPLPQSFYEKMDGFIFYVMESFDKKNHTFSESDLEQLVYRCIDNFKIWVNNALVVHKTNEENRTYKITHQTQKDWIMVTSDFYIFDLLYELGHNKIIFWKEAINNTYSYTIGKKSEFVSFPIRKILESLNKIEEGWGGGSTIGGSPRLQDGSRSKIPPEKLIELVNEILDFENEK